MQILQNLYNQLPTFVNGISENKPVPDQFWCGVGNRTGLLLSFNTDRSQGGGIDSDGGCLNLGHGIGYFSGIGSRIA
jgi:hypothetical protein